MLQIQFCVKSGLKIHTHILQRLTLNTVLRATTIYNLLVVIG